MNPGYILIAHELMCFLLLWTVFCRCLKTDHRVRLDVRIAFFVLGIVACFGIVSPVCFGVTPDPFALLLLFSIVAVQTSTSRYWIKGVPESFLKPEFIQRRRRAGDVDKGVAV